MSLESSVSALVGATNKLTDTVSRKTEEIDKKVDVATRAVPAAVRDQMRLSRYVSYEDGSDRNDGENWSSSKKTIGGAINSAPSGSYVSIYLKSGQTHYLDSTDYCSNKVVEITADGYVGGDISTYVRIESLPYIQGDGTVWAHGLYPGLSSLIRINGCTLATAKLSAQHAGQQLQDYKLSVIKTGSSKGVVFLNHCQIEINHVPFMHQHTSGSMGISDLLMRSVDVVKVDLTNSPMPTGRQFLMGNYGRNPVPFQLYGVTMSLTGAESWAEVIDQDTSNALTNLV